MLKVSLVAGDEAFDNNFILAQPNFELLNQLAQNVSNWNLTR